jgi:hypothetical protein
VNGCRKFLEFTVNEAEKLIPSYSSFMVKNTEFEKIRKAFEAKPAAKRTQADIDAYNKAVNDINAALNDSNKTLESLNNGRTKALDAWNTSSKNFVERHIPRG